MSSTPVSEQQIVAALHRVPADRWPEVLEFIGRLEGGRPGGVPPAAAGGAAPERRWTPAELRQLPLEQRDAILAEQAARAEADYRNDPDLTAFGAFGEEDLYGDSAGAETR
jgi:hypothetical protein